jgi:hypothetical protein
VISLHDYWIGRDRQFPMAMSPDLEHNAAIMVELANKLLVLAHSAGITLPTNPHTGSVVSSGWRPASINAATPNAAPNSKHMTGQAIDLYDPDGDLDEWLISADGQKVMADLGLWHEHPSATKGWAHVQSLPPRSGRRTFYP